MSSLSWNNCKFLIIVGAINITRKLFLINKAGYQCRKCSVSPNLHWIDCLMPIVYTLIFFTWGCSNHSYLEDSERRQGFYNGYYGYYQCDNNLAFGWYRFRGAAGTQMPTKCVGRNRCSTHAPGWLNASHPSVEDGIVTAKVCFHWTSGCCTWSTNIRVLNCGGFYVYELRPPPVCHLRYCGNGGCKYRYSNDLGSQS